MVDRAVSRIGLKLLRHMYKTTITIFIIHWCVIAVTAAAFRCHVELSKLVTLLASQVVVMVAVMIDSLDCMIMNGIMVPT